MFFYKKNKQKKTNKKKHSKQLEQTPLYNIKKGVFIIEETRGWYEKQKIYTRVSLKTGDIDENGQRILPIFRPSVVCHDRYRLVHRWVPAMVLNVQSGFPVF
ncbi:hypothetical protein EON70_00745 [bacterium]|nr:MAG: hypothetical protein EON70_00745 [bacterium]